MRMSTLLPSILIACQGTKADTGPVENNSECEWGYCYEMCMEPYESNYEFSVAQTEFDTYLDADGQLTEAKCEELCIVKIQEENWESIHEFQECTHNGADPDTDDSQLISCLSLIHI